LQRRVLEIQAGAFQAELDALKALPIEELKSHYAARQIEA
jgi:hypothetical protein